jgi:hypothetical protein
MTGCEEADDCSRLRGPPGPPSHGLLGCNVVDASPAIHPNVASNAAEPNVRGGRCNPRRRSREALRTDAAHR